MIKIGHEFEKEKGGVCGKAWREEREWRNVVIKLLSPKIKNKEF